MKSATMESYKNEILQQVVQNPKTVHALTATSGVTAAFSQWMQSNSGWLFALAGLVISAFLAINQWRTSRVIRARELKQIEREDLEIERLKKIREEEEQRKQQGKPLRRSTDPH